MSMRRFLLTCLVGCFTSVVTGAENGTVMGVVPTQSGASEAAAVSRSVVDDALVPIDDQTRLSDDIVDQRDTAVEHAPTAAPEPLWEQLARLSDAQRANAVIELEAGSGARRAEAGAAAWVTSLWNDGDYDAALAELRALEQSGAAMSLGIAWITPQPLGQQRGLDVRIGGTRTDAQTMNLDYDAQTGNVFAVLRWGSTTGTSAWTMNTSTDGGATWAETYSFSSAVGMIDVDCSVVDDYVYVAYVVGNATDEARLRRCQVSNGAIDSLFGYQVVFDAGADAVEEVALASNADDTDNRIYYAIIQSNDVFRWAYDAASDGTTFVEDSPATSNPEYGLDMTWDNNRDNCAQFVYVSYAGNDGDIHVLGHTEFDWFDWSVEPGTGGFRATAISAYGDTIICAFEYPYSEGTGIRYRISYNCGASWSPGAIAVPDGSSVYGYFEPDVDARDGDGTAMIYQAEAGEIDPMYYRTRVGFAPGAWSDPAIFSDYDVYTGSDTTIAYLPPQAGELFSHGAMYLSLDPDIRTPYFDRPGAAGASCDDTTPPEIVIDSPGLLECACDTVDIVGSVDDPDGAYVQDRLEVRRRGTSDWVTVATQFGARSGVLYTWDTTGWPQDFYQVRVIGENECALSASDSTLVYKPTTFSNVEIRTPVNGSIYGGRVCVDGTAWTQSCFAGYTVSYRPAGGGAWQPVDPDYPVYTASVIDDPLAYWDTVALGLPDGTYDLRVVGQDECGNANTETVTVVIDNTVPVAEFSSIVNCDVFMLGSSIDIYGEVGDKHLVSWTIDVIGGPYSQWQTIAGPFTSDAAGLLYTWDTSGLPACAYTLRLRAADASVVNCGPYRHDVEEHVSIVVGPLGSADLDGDGDVDITDFMLFQPAFTGPLP